MNEPLRDRIVLVGADGEFVGTGTVERFPTVPEFLAGEGRYFRFHVKLGTGKFQYVEVPKPDQEGAIPTLRMDNAEISQQPYWKEPTPPPNNQGSPDDVSGLTGLSAMDYGDALHRARQGY